jgi:DNA-binding NarL/FixJ family response regulator
MHDPVVNAGVTSARIVIADDVDALRRLLLRIFERDGRFEVVGEAQDGAEAVQLVEMLKPDLVILDLMMPEMSGLQASRQIREASPSTKIMILSGIAAEGVIRDVGADGFLEKGASANEILAMVESLVSPAEAEG